jgi:hypothetical protein
MLMNASIHLAATMPHVTTQKDHLLVHVTLGTKEMDSNVQVMQELLVF